MDGHRRRAVRGRGRLASRAGATRPAWLDALRRTLGRRLRAPSAWPIRVHPGRRDPGPAAPAADPFLAVLLSTLAAARRRRTPCRGCAGWSCCGAVDPGRGTSHAPHGRRIPACAGLARPGPRRPGRPAVSTRATRARMHIWLARHPLLAAIIERMTDRQRLIARLALVDGLRQSEIADAAGRVAADGVGQLRAGRRAQPGPTGRGRPGDLVGRRRAEAGGASSRLPRHRRTHPA